MYVYVCVCVSGQLWRVIKQTATVISFAFFLLFVVGGGREKLLTKYGQVRVTDCEYIKHRQVSISVGEDRPAVAVAESESKLPSPSRSQSQSQFMWQKCHSQRKETKRDLLYFTLISSAQDLQNIKTSPPRALSSFFFLFSRLFSFFGNGLWWSLCTFVCLRQIFALETANDMKRQNVRHSDSRHRLIPSSAPSPCSSSSLPLSMLPKSSGNCWICYYYCRCRFSGSACELIKWQVGLMR